MLYSHSRRYWLRFFACWTGHRHFGKRGISFFLFSVWPPFYWFVFKLSPNLKSFFTMLVWFANINASMSHSLFCIGCFFFLILFFFNLKFFFIHLAISTTRWYYSILLPNGWKITEYNVNTFNVECFEY